MIDVIEEGVQRFHPLAYAAVNALPLPGRYDPRHAVKRDQPLGPSSSPYTLKVMPIR